MLIVNARIQIPSRELGFSFARSSGPGGQNVNKLSTKATLRWKVLSSHSLPQDVRDRFLAQYRQRITEQGDVLITSQRYRDQSRNKDDCLEKLRHMLETVAQPPKVRKKSGATRAAHLRRLKSKTQHSQKKQARRPPAMSCE